MTISRQAPSVVAVSTVTPVYRGAETLPELVRRLQVVRDSWSGGSRPLELVESIFVDDGSIDDSARVLARLEDEHDFVRVVTLSRNFGQHPATTAGILHSSGDWVVTLDEDLQHAPEQIAELLDRAVAERRDVTYARPTGRVHAGYRDAASRLYKSLLSVATADPNVRYFNSFRCMRGSVARAAAAVGSHDTYFDIALGWFTQRVGSVPLPLRDERHDGRSASGYSFRSLLSHARRAIVSSQTKWLRFGAVMGMGAMLLSLVVFVVILVQKILFPTLIEVRGWTSLLLAVVFFGGLTSFLLGVILEYLSTLLFRAHGKPSFFVVDRSQDAILQPFFQHSARTGDSARSDS